MRGTVNYSAGSRQQVTRTKESLNLPPENEYFDIESNGRFKLENRLLEIKAQVEGRA